MALFTMSFPAILQYAAQNLTYKMDVLESFLVTQVRGSVCFL